jgi:hypothetical protein
MLVIIRLLNMSHRIPSIEQEIRTLRVNLSAIAGDVSTVTVENTEQRQHQRIAAQIRYRRQVGEKLAEMRLGAPGDHKPFTCILLDLALCERAKFVPNKTSLIKLSVRISNIAASGDY